MNHIDAGEKLRYLHLSDLHLQSNSEPGQKNLAVQTFNQNMVVTSLVKAVEKMEKGKSLDFVIITGDIAYGGKSEQYKVAKEFCQALLKAVNLSSDRLYLVPGNHDVDWDKIKPICSKLYAFSNQDEISALLRDQEVLSISVMRKFTGFNNFVKQVMGTGYFDEKTYHFTRTLTLKKKGRTYRINLVGLNSALFADHNDADKQKLALGLWQVQPALEDLDKGAILSIGFFHHPFGTFHVEEKVCQNLLEEKLDLILTGHLHQPDNTFISDSAGNHVSISAGAAYETRESCNSFNLIEIDLNTGQGEVEIYKYVPDENNWRRNLEVNNSSFVLNISPRIKDMAVSDGQTKIPPAVVFRYYGPLKPNSLMFRGYKNELQRLKRACQETVRSYYIVYGGCQTGKTSLWIRFAASLPELTAKCHIDFQYIPNAELSDAVSYLAKGIASSLDVDISQEVRDGPELVYFLCKTLKERKVEFFVLFLEGLGYLPQNTREDLANIFRWIFSNRYDKQYTSLKRLLIILAGGIELYDLAASEVSPLRNVCEEIYLSDLKEPDAIRLIIDGLVYIGVPEEHAEKAGRAIYEKAEGHPYLTQHMGGLLEEKIREGTLIPSRETEIAAKAIVEITDELLKQNPLLFREIRLGLFEYTLSEAANSLSKEPVKFSRTDDEMVQLELLGLIKEKDGYWVIRNPLLAEACMPRAKFGSE